MRTYSVVQATTTGPAAKQWTALPAMSWPAFVGWLDLDDPAETKESRPGYIPGVLHGTRRCRDAVVNRSMITVDEDDAGPGFVDEVAHALGGAFAAHTTFRHGVDGDRWRLIVPLSRDVTPDEYWLIAGAVQRAIGCTKDTGGQEPERFMYPPAATDRTQYQQHVEPGEPLDVDEWLRRAKELEIRPRDEVAPIVEVDGPSYAELTDAQREQADRHVEAVLFDWAARLAPVAQWPEGERDDRGRGWDALARDAAWSIAILVASPWTPPLDGEATFRQVMPDVMLADRKCQKWRADLPAKAAREVEPAPWADPVFDATPTLQHVRQAAHARLETPSALLLATLARLAVEVPVETVLPAVRSTVKPINIGLALVGGPSDGKSTVFKLSRELLGLVGEDQKRDVERPSGSGEGMIQSFLDDKQNLIADPRRLFFADEIGLLATVKDSRSGSTLGPVLRSMLTGEMLGTLNAEKSRRRHVPEGSYRAVLIAGVQPAASDTLLNEYDASVGTPQRFVWIKVTDPTLYQLADQPPTPWPGALTWEPPSVWPTEIEYPDHVKALVRKMAIERHNPDRDPDSDRLDGHAMLTRLKVAFLIAVLHGETAITDRWWHLAGIVADDWTAEAIGVCRTALGEIGARRDKLAGEAMGRRKLAEVRVVEKDQRAVESITRTVLDKVAEAGEDGISSSVLRRAIRAGRRDVYDRLVGSPDDPGPLVDTGQIRLTEAENRGTPGVRVYAK